MMAALLPHRGLPNLRENGCVMTEYLEIVPIFLEVKRLAF